MSGDLRYHAVPVLSGAALFGSCVLSFFPDLATAPVSTAGVAISSIIPSYWMTQISEKKRFDEQKKEIGRVAIRRAQNLSDDLTDFSSHLRNHNLDSDTVSFWLESKARDALTSLDDIRDMAGMTGDASVAAQREQRAILDFTNPQKSQSALPTDVNVISAEVSVSCVKCGTNNEVFLPTTPTSTRMFTCRNCEYRQNVHRLVGGGYKVSDPLKNSTPLSSIACPTCKNQIPMPNVTNLDVPVRRLCLNCTTPIEYFPKLASATVLTIPDQKRSVTNMAASFSCQCGKSFDPKALKDHEHKDYFACYNCLRVYYFAATTA